MLISTAIIIILASDLIAFPVCVVMGLGQLLLLLGLAARSCCLSLAAVAVSDRILHIVETEIIARVMASSITDVGLDRPVVLRGIRHLRLSLSIRLKPL